MDEIWKPIPGYEKLYEASNLGRIRSVEHTISYMNQGIKRTRTFPGRILKPQPNVNGRYHVRLSKEGTITQLMLHRIIALTFHGAPCAELEVNHKDGNKTNNEAENLEWVTRSENVLHSKRVLKKQIGSQNPSSKLTEDDVRQIRLEYRPGTGFHNRGNAVELAKQYSVSWSTINNVVKRRSWRHVT